jgi:hypothetical protein
VWWQVAPDGHGLHSTEFVTWGEGGVGHPNGTILCAWLFTVDVSRYILLILTTLCCPPLLPPCSRSGTHAGCTSTPCLHSPPAHRRHQHACPSTHLSCWGQLVAHAAQLVSGDNHHHHRWPEQHMHACPSSMTMFSAWAASASLAVFNAGTAGSSSIGRMSSSCVAGAQHVLWLCQHDSLWAVIWYAWCSTTCGLLQCTTACRRGVSVYNHVHISTCTYVAAQQQDNSRCSSCTVANTGLKSRAAEQLEVAADNVFLCVLWYGGSHGSAPPSM